MRWLDYQALKLLRWLARTFPRVRVPAWVPLAGAIDGHSWAPPVEVRGTFGSSMTIPAILAIRIDGQRGATEPSVLQPVATRIFPNYAPFVFNVSFACGAAKAFRPGVYGDPRSPWFNVFVGYYEIVAAKAAWDRPFAYTADGAIAGGDLKRLGDADWNYFSNFMYGVPLESIEPCDAPTAHIAVVGRERIGAKRWDVVDATDMRVASAYLANDGAKLEDNAPILTGIWQCVFGEPYRADDPPKSFFVTPMRARLYACFTEVAHHPQVGGPAWCTFIFGGTVNDWWAQQAPGRAAQNDEFLALQSETIRALIARSFPDLGFPQ